MFKIGKSGVYFDDDRIKAFFLFRKSLGVFDFYGNKLSIDGKEVDVFVPNQKHTNVIKHFSEASGEFDGLWARFGEGVALGVKTADCSPVVFWDDRIYGILHAGWRGVVSGIIEKALELLNTQKAKFVIGPTIRACCYEVKEDVAEKFEEIAQQNLKFSEKVVIIYKDKKIFVDIPSAIELKLVKGGVRRENIYVFEGCTYCDGRFASRRRQKDKNDWQISFVVEK